MTNSQLKTALTLLNYTLGAVITVTSISLFAERGLVAPLYITAAILIVGPIENLLMGVVKPEDRWIVDQLTSVAFLILLLLAVLELSK